MIMHILKNGIPKHKPVTIIYDHDGEITQRNIQVIGFDDKYVYAFCLLREEYRKFKIENILAADYYIVPMHQHINENYRDHHRAVAH